MAVCEALLNLAGAHIPQGLPSVRLSANWMSCASLKGEGAGLYQAAVAIGLELCPELGVTIPVGKDSMSMKCSWIDEDSKNISVTAPMSVVITAFGPVVDSRLNQTPRLMPFDIAGDSLLVFMDLAGGKMRLGGSCIAQVYNQVFRLEHF
jgi:phosphoribosylformylglycinamidine synthase